MDVLMDGWRWHLHGLGASNSKLKCSPNLASSLYWDFDGPQGSGVVVDLSIYHNVADAINYNITQVTCNQNLISLHFHHNFHRYY